MSKRVRVRVVGRVQGVFFRASVRREAVARGVRGWVRNLADGSVEAVLEGPEEGLAGVIEYCRVGPVGARVDRLEQQDEPVGEELRSFAIHLG